MEELAPAHGVEELAAARALEQRDEGAAVLVDVARVHAQHVRVRAAAAHLGLARQLRARPLGERRERDDLDRERLVVGGVDDGVAPAAELRAERDGAVAEGDVLAGAVRLARRRHVCGGCGVACAAVACVAN